MAKAPVKKTPVKATPTAKEQGLADLTNIYGTAKRDTKSTQDALMKSLGAEQAGANADLSALSGQLGGTGNSLKTMLSIPGAAASSIRTQLMARGGNTQTALSQREAASKSGLVSQTDYLERAGALDQDMKRQEINRRAYESKVRAQEKAEREAEKKRNKSRQYNNEIRGYMEATGITDPREAARAMAEEDPDNALNWLGAGRYLYSEDEEEAGGLAESAIGEFYAPMEEGGLKGQLNRYDALEYIRQKYGDDAADAVQNDVTQKYGADAWGAGAASTARAPAASGGGQQFASKEEFLNYLRGGKEREGVVPAAGRYLDKAKKGYQKVEGPVKRWMQDRLGEDKY